MASAALTKSGSSTLPIFVCVSFSKASIPHLEPTRSIHIFECRFGNKVLRRRVTLGGTPSVSCTVDSGVFADEDYMRFRVKIKSSVSEYLVGSF